MCLANLQDISPDMSKHYWNCVKVYIKDFGIHVDDLDLEVNEECCENFDVLWSDLCIHPWLFSQTVYRGIGCCYAVYPAASCLVVSSPSLPSPLPQTRHMGGEEWGKVGQMNWGSQTVMVVLQHASHIYIESKTINAQTIMLAATWSNGLVQNSPLAPVPLETVWIRTTVKRMRDYLSRAKCGH